MIQRILTCGMARARELPEGTKGIAALPQFMSRFERFPKLVAVPPYDYGDASDARLRAHVEILPQFTWPMRLAKPNNEKP